MQITTPKKITFVSLITVALAVGTFFGVDWDSLKMASAQSVVSLETELKGHVATFNADQCEQLHGEFIRLQESKYKYEKSGEAIPQWLVDALTHNTTKKTEFNCQY